MDDVPFGLSIKGYAFNAYRESIDRIRRFKCIQIWGILQHADETEMTSAIDWLI